MKIRSQLLKALEVCACRISLPDPNPWPKKLPEPVQAECHRGSPSVQNTWILCQVRLVSSRHWPWSSRIWNLAVGACSGSASAYFPTRPDRIREMSTRPLHGYTHRTLQGI